MCPARPRGRTKAQQRDDTTRSLLRHARDLFATRGYHQVSLAEIVDAAGVTKGALYHHFPAGKDALFRAVLDAVHHEVAERIEAAATGQDTWTQLVDGCYAFLSSSTEPGIQQIMLVDAPAVLGWGTWRELDAATSMRQLSLVLAQLIEEGTIEDQPIEPVANLLSGAMNEAALWLAHSPDRERDLALTWSALQTLLVSLRREGHRPADQPTG